ncbi:Ff.00g075150.m01.CDS01 [Fusarium sp. VM40]|nr:Ff.00g075150.m01.CDS01 [Fusarium sp. VM40]
MSSMYISANPASFLGSPAMSVEIIVPTMGKRPCATCGVSFDTVEEHREHAKSPSHLHNLQFRIAVNDATPHSKLRKWSEADELFNEEANTLSEDEENITEPEEEYEEDCDEVPEFNPGRCLFCHHRTSSFDKNLSHMEACHGFGIPYPKYLTVEPENLIWYLHYVIFGSFQCMYCEKQRYTLEAIQHHMQAKDHCRFQMTPEMLEFYDAEAMESNGISKPSGVNAKILRRQSGKPLVHRSKSPLSTRMQVRKMMHINKRKSLPAGVFANPRSIRDTETTHPLDFVPEMQGMTIANYKKFLIEVTEYQDVMGRIRGKRDLAKSMRLRHRFAIHPGLGDVGKNWMRKKKMAAYQDYYFSPRL